MNIKNYVSEIRIPADKNFKARHFHALYGKRGGKKRPPYFNYLNSSYSGKMIIICTGTDAWRRAESATWYPGCKVLLPPGHDPSIYDWSSTVSHDVIIGGFGNLEPLGSIGLLGGLLLSSGARSVLYAPERDRIIRIVQREEAA